MFRHVFALLLLLALVGQSSAADWITAPSYYTHSPTTGERVTQYTPVGPVYNAHRNDYVQSGYRHTRSSLQQGRSIDHLHIVEEWGRPVRPYGEWRYPFRPYSVPYAAWGPPFAGLGGWGGWGPWQGGGWGGGGGGWGNGIPPAAWTPSTVPNNPGLGFPGPGGIYPFSDEHYPLNRGNWGPAPTPFPNHPPSSGMGGT